LETHSAKVLEQRAGSTPDFKHFTSRKFAKNLEDSGTPQEIAGRGHPTILTKEKPVIRMILHDNSPNLMRGA
jgi:hypothetical protein